MSKFKVGGGGRYGMHSGNAHFKNLEVDNEMFLANKAINVANTPGKVYYVDRNHNLGAGTGDGSSWDNAFLTIGEAIAAVNADYTAATGKSRGRNAVIYIAEGWYIEVPSATNLVLTANDVTIIGVAPGNHDQTVLAGSSVAGTLTIGSGFPALTIQGYNNTVMNLGLFTHDNTEPSLRIGGHSSGSTGQSLATGNKVINCAMIRNADNGSAVGIETSDQDGCLIQGCLFTTSCKDSGIQIISNGSTNPVNVTIEDCDFVGVPTGIDANAGHNITIRRCVFLDDSSDRPGTLIVPCAGAGASSVACYDSFAEGIAENSFVTGATVNLEGRNTNLD